ncbi:MAG: hypothetical protein ACK2UO_03710 [Caldilineaceae bacterium]|jgi:hypothetical protein
MRQAPRRDASVTLPIAKLRFYLNEWREEPEWPDIQVSLLLILYDLLLLADTPEKDMSEAFGDDGVRYVVDIVDSPKLLGPDDYAPWDPLPCLASNS